MGVVLWVSSVPEQYGRDMYCQGWVDRRAARRYEGRRMLCQKRGRGVGQGCSRNNVSDDSTGMKDSRASSTDGAATTTTSSWYYQPKLPQAVRGYMASELFTCGYTAAHLAHVGPRDGFERGHVLAVDQY
eukprot:3940613-Rhodomonas_salina.1